MRKPRPSKVTTSLSLPTSPNEPSDNLSDYTVLIFGRKGIGKSTLGSSWPDSINFQTEPGRRNLPIIMLPENPGEHLTWKSCLDYFSLFAESKDYQTAVIDTVDRLYDLCYNHVCQHNFGIEQPSEAGRDSSSVWKSIKNEFEQGLEMARSTGKTLVFVSHDRETNQEDDTRIEPTCPGQARNVMQAICDIVLHYYFYSGKRILGIRNYDNTSWCSCGLNEHFLDPDGDPLERVELPNDPTKVFSTVQKAFNNELRDFDYVPPKPKRRVKKKKP